MVTLAYYGERCDYIGADPVQEGSPTPLMDHLEANPFETSAESWRQFFQFLAERSKRWKEMTGYWQPMYMGGNWVSFERDGDHV